MIKWISFAMFIYGVLTIFDISIMDMMDELSNIIDKKKTLKQRIKEIQSTKRPRGFKKIVYETKYILKATNREDTFRVLVVVSLALSLLGIFIGMTSNNIYLVPVLGFGLSLLPFYYTLYTFNGFKRMLNEELETSLSIITTSYLRSDNIILAIEENINHINPPLQDSFRRFLVESKLINSNTKLAVTNLKNGIDNEVFREWCDTIINCIDNKTLKTTLLPVIAKLSDMRIVSGELDLIISNPVREFITMVILLLSSIPIMYFLNRDWYVSLIETTVGNLILAICMMCIFISTGRVIKHSKPIEYRR